jgi:hypothetical protein
LSSTDGNEDRKKSHIDLVQKFVLDVIEGLEAHRARYRSLTESVESDFTTRRNNILVSFLSVASIILGLSTVFKEFILLLLTLLALDLGIGLMMFLVVSRDKRKVHDYMSEMDSSFFSSKGKIVYFRSRALSQTYNLDDITEKKIYFYYEFTNVAAAAAALDLKDKFEKMLKYKPFSKIKKELEEGLATMTGEVNNGTRVYQDRDRNAKWATNYPEDLGIFKIIFKDFFDYLATQERAKRQE